MHRYIIWDKKSDIFTLGRDNETGKTQWTAAEYIDYYAPWANNPNAKIIVGGGIINGTVFMEFEATKAMYLSHGAEITEDMNDREVLDVIEAFEDKQPEAENIITAEERIAAALEMIALEGMEDIT